MGDPDAPLTVTEFVDLQCPFCAQVSATTLPTIVNDYGRSGKVQLHVLGPDSTVAAGAERQGKLWPFLEVFYAKQGQANSGYVTDEFAGVPVALLGLIGYAWILVTLLRDDPAARGATALLALTGAGFSAWLTYVEVVRLDAICIWCVASAICMSVLAVLSSARMLAPEPVRG